MDIHKYWTTDAVVGKKRISRVSFSFVEKEKARYQWIDGRGDRAIRKNALTRAFYTEKVHLDDSVIDVAGAGDDGLGPFS